MTATVRERDAVVVGLGAMGSAALRALARRGLDVLGLDAHAPPHTLGSSHGESRIIRENYFEDPAYVPLVHRAYELWAELERESGRRLLDVTGGLLVGPPDGAIVSGALRSARQHGLAHERIGADEIRRRFPAFDPGPGMEGLFEPRAGVLDPEACVAAQLESARRHGAETRFDEPVRAWSAAGAGLRVETDRGRYRARRVVLSAGAWMAGLVPELAPLLAVERVALHWFLPLDPEPLDPARCPVSIWEVEPDRCFYAFPARKGRVKAAFHHQGSPADPERVAREVAPAEAEPLRALLARHLPAAAGALDESAACLYTNTPDGHFAVDRHPRHPEVVVVSACSGHGFKFAPAVGEMAAELAAEGRPRLEIPLFRLAARAS